jgi:hypothetical protein
MRYPRQHTHHPHTPFAGAKCEHTTRSSIIHHSQLTSTLVLLKGMPSMPTLSCKQCTVTKIG